jgi:asparagine synthase (glutamine-hydrolysing)
VDLQSGRVEERKFYEIRYEPDHSLKERDLIEPLYEQMKDSVRRNLISDAPLGLTLSGGFDTSTILALTRELVGDEEIHTFSIVVEEPSFDESRYQYQMVDPTHHTHHEVRVGPQEVMDGLVQHMAFMDEPSGDGGAVPFYLLAREATKYVKVLLSGEGGDETFNAYETHLASKVRGMYRGLVPRPVRSFNRWLAHALPTNYKKLSFDFLMKRFTTGAELGVPESHLYWRHPMLEADKRQLMPDCSDVRPTSQLFVDLYNSLDFPDDLDRISVMDIQHYFIGDLMVKNDRMMMAHSIEARFPYMDRILLDFMSKIPARLRLKGLKRRSLQKAAMKGRVPRAIYKRQNMGLEMPHSVWFMKEFQPLADRYFSPKAIERTGFLHPPTVTRLWQEHISRKRDNGRALWCLLNLLVWLDLFVYNRDYKSYLANP